MTKLGKTKNLEKKPKYCEKCGSCLKTIIQSPGRFNVTTGEEEFYGLLECPKRSGIFSGHSSFKGMYSGMGEFFIPFIFNSQGELIRIGD